MMALAAVTLVVLWFCLAMFFVRQTVYSEWPAAWCVALVVWVILTIWAVVEANQAEDRRGPCLRHETVLVYNAALKQSLPARRCVERGEWVQQ